MDLKEMAKNLEKSYAKLAISLLGYEVILSWQFTVQPSNRILFCVLCHLYYLNTGYCRSEIPEICKIFIIFIMEDKWCKAYQFKHLSKNVLSWFCLILKIWFSVRREHIVNIYIYHTLMSDYCHQDGKKIRMYK